MEKDEVESVRTVAAEVIKALHACHAQARMRALLMEAAYEQVQTSAPTTQLAVRGAGCRALDCRMKLIQIWTMRRVTSMALLSNRSLGQASATT